MTKLCRLLRKETEFRTEDDEEIGKGGLSAWLYLSTIGGAFAPGSVTESQRALESEPEPGHTGRGGGEAVGGRHSCFCPGPEGTGGGLGVQEASLLCFCHS